MKVASPASSIIRLSKSCISVAEREAVMKVLEQEYLGMGQEVQEFEQALEVFFNRRVLCVSSGTAALHLALQACGIGAGDEVLVPSLTYVASFQAISATGAKPVACDVDPLTLTLDCDDAKLRITPATKAIMPVHYTGGVGDLDKIYQFARQHNIRVIEDAAHAFGTTYHGGRVGSFGDIACFSFDGIKNITSGEGGCIVLDDPEVYKRISNARLLGVENDAEKRYQGKRSWDFNVSCQGWRYHMSNIMAAIGIEQLKRFKEMAEVRQRNAILYDGSFADNEYIRPLQHDYSVVVPHIYVVRIPSLKKRASLRARLLECNIQTGIHYQPNHWHSYYSNDTTRELLVTESIYPEILTLPLHAELTKEAVLWVCENIKREVMLMHRMDKQYV
ncbi:MAG: DegT/DnrJ/EryC1/StrS family aminotransferase [Coxiellaceae bacterium]|nr:DegT/DnrJ/EryC1/StrS family aminotransferase [Coxiellaceae bacterium]